MSTYGIDLGTTYSCIAKLDQNGNPEVIQNYVEGSYTLASAVFFEEESGNTLYGESAKEYMETSPERLVQFAKREIGKPNGKVYKIDDKEYTPIEISALILKKLKQMAEEQGENVSDVIITCPAYFGFEEKMATRKAGELAGMNVLNLVNEPTAAAINYCYREFQENQVVVVYDLGGGTFDVTVLRMSMVKDESGNNKQQMKVLASTGNDRLGGKDWDDILYHILLDRYCQEIGMSADELDADTRQSVRSKVEKTKKTLTESDSAKVRIKSDAGPVKVEVTREEFEEATGHLVVQTIDLLDLALREAGDVNIDKVLLVGGSTNMPMIKAVIKEKFPGLVQVEDPEKAVAKGAAIYASILVEEEEVILKPTPKPDPDEDEIVKPDPVSKPSKPTGIGEIEVVDQVPRSFGPGVFIKKGNTKEYMVDNLVLRGTEIPATSTKVYGTMADNQEAVSISVFESMTLEETVRPCEDPEGNTQDTNPEYLMKALGKLILELPPNTPEGTEIEVTFMIDVAGIHVTARNLATGEANTTRIEYATSMTKEQTEDSLRKLNGLSLND